MPDLSRLIGSVTRRALLFGAFGLLVGLAPAAFAQEGIVEDCEIEEFDYEERQGRLYISGTATCSEGRLEMTIFDDESGEELAEDFTYIMDNAFELHLNASVPESIVIEYTIE